MLFLVQIRRLYQGGNLQQLEWDMATVTAGDYTVEWKIKADKYEKWDSQVYDQSGTGHPEGLFFKDALKKELEGILNQKLREMRATHSQHGGTRENFEYYDLWETDIEIADIQLAYHNGELIKLLKGRGYYICHNQFDKIKEVDNKIKALFDDETKKDKLIKPSAAFIIFVKEDSYNFATDLTEKESQAKKKDKNFKRTMLFPNTMNQNLRLLKASEPTDIIWENRAFSVWDHRKREFLAYSIIAILLFGIFYFTYLVAFQSSQVKKVFPPQDCAGIYAVYGEHIQESAIQDFDWVEKNAFQGTVSSGAW